MRKLHLVSVLASLAASTLSWNAAAQGVDEFGAYGGLERSGYQRTPQEVAFEIRFGHYVPNVDSDVDGSPYEDIFGDEKRWQVGIESDWQLLRWKDYLSFGPGVGFAYTRSSAKAPLESGDGLSEQDTALNIFALHAVGVLRVDFLANHTPIPLAPYAKLGFGYAYWWTILGENVPRPNGVLGRDTSFGLVFALGLAFRLDWLDPRDAASADAAVGLNHTALFGEWFNSDLSSFGESMQVGTNTWVAGLLLEL